MSIFSCRRATSAAAFAAVVAISAAAQGDKPALPRQAPSYTSGWVELSPEVSKESAHGTVSALPTSIGKTDSEIATPERAAKLLGYNPGDIQREFSLEKTTFLLGEPLLVKFGIELQGDGKWHRDDWIYNNNRDETFIIVMRDKNGRWVPDRYPLRDLYTLGGMIASETFDRNSPEIHWLPAQQYCAIAKVGEYELYCMKWDTRCEHQNKDYPVSPLRAKIPPDVIAEIKRRPIVRVDGITDYAHFRVSIVNGEGETRARMVQSWTGVVLSGDEYVRGDHRGKANATYRAWQHSLQSNFLPYLKPWREGPFVWFRISKEFNRWETTSMTRSQAADVIPKLIEKLGDDDPCVRSEAEFHLRKWTGESFGHDWKGHQSNRPTVEEGKMMQAKWRQWWKQAEKDFREKAERRSPASK